MACLITPLPPLLDRNGALELISAGEHVEASCQ